MEPIQEEPHRHRLLDPMALRRLPTKVRQPEPHDRPIEGTPPLRGFLLFLYLFALLRWVRGVTVRGPTPWPAASANRKHGSTEFQLCQYVLVGSVALSQSGG